MSPIKGEEGYLSYRNANVLTIEDTERIRFGRKFKISQRNSSTGLDCDYYNYWCEPRLHLELGGLTEKINDIPLYSSVKSWEIYEGAITPANRDRIRILNRVTHYVNKSRLEGNLTREQFMSAHDIAVGLIYKAEYTPERARVAFECLKSGRKYEEPVKLVSKKPLLGVLNDEQRKKMEER